MVATLIFSVYSEANCNPVRAGSNFKNSLMQTTSDIYEFGSFHLEIKERRLLHNGQPVSLRAKVFDTLVALVANHGKLVTKDSLMRAVWPDAVVEEGNLAHNLTVLRKALGETDNQRFIETVPGRGYRFVASVRLADRDREQQALGSVGNSWERQLAAVRSALAAKGPAPARGTPVPHHVVGRERELADLHSALGEACSGRPQMICITGEPGIGKSTLVEQFLAQCAAAGTHCAFAIGRCSERLAESEAYLPILEALESLLAVAGGMESGELMKLVAPTWYVQVAPLWVSADPTFAAVVADAKAASRERMKRELAAFLQELARVVPVIVFVDDLHWADSSTTEVLAYLARRLSSARVLIVAAYRSSDLILSKHPFIALRQELQRQKLCRELPIGFLSPEDIEGYLRLELPAQKVPIGLPAFIHGRTEGNPLFMAELIRHLRESNTLDYRPDLREQDLPESVRSTIDRRVGCLDTEELQVLAAAAVQGQEFESRIVADMLGFDAARVEERLQSLDLVHAFIRRLHEKDLPDASFSISYKFAHVLYQHAIEEGLTPSRKMDLCKAAAEALVARFQIGTSPVASRVAILFEAARDFARASDFFIAAAANAARLFANEEAVILSGRAISNAEKLSGNRCHSRVAAAASQLGQLQMVLSRFQDAATAFERAERASQAGGDVDGQVNAICGGALAHFYQRRMELIQQMAGRALGIARNAQSELGVASAEAVLGLEQLCFGAIDAAEERFDRSVPVLIQHCPPPHALEAITFSGLLQAWQLDYSSAHKTISWTMNHARERGSSYHIILNLFVRGMALFNEGRLSDGIRDLQEGMRLAEKNGERFWLSRFPNTLGWVHRELEDIDAAIRFDSEGARAAHENGYAKPEAYSHVNLAQDYMAVGETAPVLEHLSRAMELFGADVWFRWRYQIRANAEMARYWLLKGNTQTARKYALESIAIAEPRKVRKHLAWAHKILGDVARAEDRLTEACREYKIATDLLEPGRCPLIQWRVLSARADAASACGENEAADEYRGRCRQIVHELADSLTEEKLRRQFLTSDAVQKALRL